MNKVVIKCQTLLPSSTGTIVSDTDVLLDLDEIQLASFPKTKYLEVPGSNGVCMFCISVTTKKESGNNLCMSFLTIGDAQAAWDLLCGVKPVEKVPPTSPGYYLVRHNNAWGIIYHMQRELSRKELPFRVVESQLVEPECAEVFLDHVLVATDVESLIRCLDNRSNHS